MSIKIDAPRARSTGLSTEFSEVLVRESDWRKLMAVVRAAEYLWEHDGSGMGILADKVEALRSHLEKKKK